METNVKIVYTMFESDKIPDDWVSNLKAAHKVIVPSTWCRDVFAKAGIEAQVIPLGYDNRTFKYIKRPIKRKVRKDFVFLHYNAFNIRKGFPEVFAAFKKAFRHDEPVRLMLKTALDQPPIPILPAQYPNIDVICGSVSEQKLYQIIKEADCFVFPSRGEGFGMTPLECMATGLPVIVPNAHGISEYFNDEYMYEVKVKGTCPALYTRFKGQDVGKMVVCDIDDLAAQMRYIYEHQEEAAEVGRKASEYVQQYTFERTAKSLKAVVDEFLSKPLPPPRIINYLPLKQI
jgi:glycosyltransferase involved in cell wall biosynthesis